MTLGNTTMARRIAPFLIRFSGRLENVWKSMNAPAMRQAFILIPFPRLGVEDGNKKFVMDPSKQRRFSIRVENVRVAFIEGIKLIKACFPKPFPNSIVRDLDKSAMTLAPY